MSKEFRVIYYDLKGNFSHEVAYDTLEEAEKGIEENKQDYSDFEIFECVYTLIKTVGGLSWKE